jgi:hypothetical protein
MRGVHGTLVLIYELSHLICHTVKIRDSSVFFPAIAGIQRVSKLEDVCMEPEQSTVGTGLAHLRRTFFPYEN